MPPWPSDKERRAQREAERYRELTGKEPGRLPDDHPYAWQWEYQGSKEEREHLLELLGVEEPPAVIDGQEELDL